MWVIRQTDDPCDAGAVARTVARQLGIPQDVAAAQIRDSHGNLARDVPLHLAQMMGDALQSKGVPVLLIPSREVFIPPAAVTARTVHFSTYGLRFELTASVVVKTWDDTRLISCGVVGRGGEARRVVDFFFSDDAMPTHLRVVEGTFSFDYPRMPRELRRDIAAFVEVIQTNAPDVPMNRGMHLTDHDPQDPAWECLRFDNARAFDEYNTWFLQLTGAGSMKE